VSIPHSSPGTLAGKRSLFAVALLIVSGLLVGGGISLRNPVEADRLPAPMNAATAFEDLQENRAVQWLVRLIAYDATTPELRIDQLKTLGAPHENFIFVADYAELRGYTANEAIHLAGGSLATGQQVSAVLFPLPSSILYPASVRGLLQVVQRIDQLHAQDANYRPSGLDAILSAEERQDLSDVSLPSWAWNRYRGHFRSYEAKAKTLRDPNAPADAIRFIGHIGGDWCEPGCASLHGHQVTDRQQQQELELPGGETITIERFGVRVFLINNFQIANLPGRMLIDFNEPDRQRIPYIELPSDQPIVDTAAQR